MVNFLFYAGNARAGSTWLYNEMNSREDCEFSPIKEHFLFQDFSFFPGFDKNVYFGFYQSLMNSDTKLMGDMSPTNAYATLDQLKWYHAEMLNHGFNVLPMITLRDPADQIVSLTKLGKTISGAISSGQASFDDPNSLARFMGNHSLKTVDVTLDDIMSMGLPPFIEQAVSWKTTIENCKTVFGKIHINFYEKFFTEESISDMFRYLEIDYKDMNISKKIFSFGSNNPLTEQEKYFLYENYPFYKENYQFAVETFGKEFIESIWWTPNK